MLIFSSLAPLVSCKDSGTQGNLQSAWSGSCCIFCSTPPPPAYCISSALTPAKVHSSLDPVFPALGTVLTGSTSFVWAPGTNLFFCLIPLLLLLLSVLLPPLTGGGKGVVVKELTPAALAQRQGLFGGLFSSKPPGFDPTTGALAFDFLLVF